ncbi:hypothetical protein BH11PLA2_BH11PLA2_48610 [soil metagenome]
MEHEAEPKAKSRRNVAGGVPYLSLTERPDDDKANVFSIGTLPRAYCDHEARMVRPLKATEAEWTAVFAAVTPRWEDWLKSSPELKDGKVRYGPVELKSTTLSDVLYEVRKP